MGNLDLRFDYATGTYLDGGLEFSIGHYVCNRSVVLTQKCFGFTGAGRHSHGAFSWQGPIVTATYLAVGIIGYGGVTMKAAQTPVFEYLLVPSSELTFRVAPRLFLGVNNNTEYVLIKNNHMNRGIYYTPSFAAVYWNDTNDETSDTFVLKFVTGPTLCWNFDGKNYYVGWSLGVTIRFGYY